MTVKSEHKKCFTPCNLCGSCDVEELSLIGRGGKHLRTVICKDCGLVWTDPLPFEIKEYYEKEYRIKYKGSYEPKLKHVHRAGKVALNRLKKIEKFLSNSAEILDVGSGGGEFLYLLNKSGYRASGIEPNIGYAEYSKREYGLTVRTGFIQDTDIPHGRYDVITVWHVLEHADNPFHVLCRLQNWLKDDGILVVEVPNVEAVCQAPVQRFHFAHLYNFNLRTLEEMGNKAGFARLFQEIAGDGGNIFMVFKKIGQPGTSKKISMPGNARQTINIIRRHTKFSHYLSTFPYKRFIGKICRIYSEQQAIKGFSNGKEILDHYYNKYVNSPEHRDRSK